VDGQRIGSGELFHQNWAGFDASRKVPDRRDNISNGVVPGTSALALGSLIRPHEILGDLVVPKFFRPDIVIADVQGTEQVGHRGDHS
jgi:hypothetical protein